jgi:hypothetical protein
MMIALSWKTDVLNHKQSYLKISLVNAKESDELLNWYDDYRSAGNLYIMRSTFLFISWVRLQRNMVT